ncbi:MAG: tripartite tricarboxylate transporter permease [Proteobacteria bacterium]|nr:tripartite tricarboxylate transporter permease [Pseudomonadota bacterium]
MEAFANIAQGLQMLMVWDLPFWIIGGLAIGIFLGSIPGVSGVLAITLLLGPSYYMPPLQAIVFLTAIYTGSVYGGGISAILLNIPGTAPAIVTGFDGYPMTQQGKHNHALGISIFSSAIGCFIAYGIVLALFFPIGKIILNFGPSEMLLVVVFAMVSIGMVQGEIVKTAIFGLFGILIGTLGSSPYGYSRGIWGIDALYEGIPLIPALLGLLAVSELFIMLEKKFIIKDGERPVQKISEIIKGMRIAMKHPKTVIRSSLLGIGIGLMPAAGSTIAAMVSYGTEKRSNPNAENFGNGEPAGIVAAETANNGSEGGAVATMMLLGIPGSGTTALLLAAFMIHGLSPGPWLVRENLDFAYAVIVSQFFQAAGLLVIATLFVNYFARLIYLPTKVLVPAVFIFAVVGAYSPRGLLIDVVIMLLFAGLGYLMKRLNYPVMGFILGFILGAIVEREMLKTFLLFEDDLLALFTRPAFNALLVLIIGSLFWPLLKKRVFKNRSLSINN